MPPRVSPHAITASVVITATVKVCRVMDKGDAKRTRYYSFPASIDGIGSASLRELPMNLHELGEEIIAKVKTWEGGPKTPGRPVVDILDTLAAQEKAAALSPMQNAILSAGGASA